MCYNGGGMSEIAVEGLEHIHLQSAWIVPNRVDVEVLTAIEAALGGMDKIVWVTDHRMLPDSEMAGYLRKGRAIGSRMRTDPADASNDIRMLLEQGRRVVLLPGKTARASGTLTDIPAEVLTFLDGMSINVVPLYVGMFNNSLVGGYTTEAPHDMVRLRFCPPLTAGAGLAMRLRRVWMENDTEYFAKHPLLQHADLAEQLVHAVCRHPDACIIDGTDDTTMSYGEVLRSAVELAKYLRRIIQSPRLGIILPPGKAATIANLACILTGISPVNINYRLSGEQFFETYEDTGLARFLTERNFKNMHPDFPWPNDRDLLDMEKILKGIRSTLSSWWRSKASLSPEKLLKSIEHRAPEPDDEALLMFTGGAAFTTPHAVPYSHRMVLAAAMQMQARAGLRSGARVLATQPLYTPAGLHTGLLLPLLCGYDMVTYTDYTMYGRLGELAADYHTDLSLSQPEFALNLIRQKEGTAGSGISRFLVEGETLPPRIINRAAQQFKTTLLSAYSMVECTSLISCCMSAPAAEADRGVTVCGAVGSAGMLMPGMSARVTEDAEGTKPAPLDAPGFLWLRGPNVLRGEESEDRDGMWFRTNDIAYLMKDGSLVILGRRNRFSRVNGKLISHHILEEALFSIYNIDKKKEPCALAIVGLEAQGKRNDLVVLLTTRPQQANEGIKLYYEILNMKFDASWVPGRILSVKSIPMLPDGTPNYLACSNYAQSVVK